MAFRALHTKKIAIVLLFAAVFSVYALLGSYVLAATYTFSQTSWAGGASATTAVHPTNESGWTNYQSSSAIAGTSTTVTLGTTTASIVVTDDGSTNAGFNVTGSSLSQVQVSGTGDSASVTLAAEGGGRPAAPSCSGTDHSGADWTVTDNDAYDLNAGAGTIEIAGDHCNVGAFLIATTTTAYIKTYADSGDQTGQLKIVAASIDIRGTLNGTARGYKGGNASIYNQNGISGTNTGSYGSAGGPGGSGGIGEEEGYDGYSGGSSVGSTRGTSNSSDVAMGGGAGSGGGSPMEGGTAGSRGGGMLNAYVTGTISVTGSIVVNGGAGGTGGTGGWCEGGGGGGAGASGGGVLLNGDTVFVPGTITANAGSGGGGGSAGDGCSPDPGTPGSLGGGGRVKLFGSSVATSTATVTATGYTSGTIYKEEFASTYSSSGTYTSGALDVGTAVSTWGTLSWTHSGGQTITLKARSDADGDFSNATAWGSCSNITSGAALSTGGCVTNGHRYIQYQATLSTGDTAVTPSLDDVTISYITYATSGTLLSSSYDTGDAANELSELAWTQDSSLPANTYAQISLRTAGTEGGLSGASWSDFTATTTGCADTEGSISCTTAIPAGMQDGSDDEWFQYKVTLAGDGAATPSITAVSVDYGIPAPTTATLTVTTSVTNDSGGTAVAGDFALTLNSVSITSGVATTTPAGSFTVASGAVSGYAITYGGDCASDGTITMVAGNSYTCSVTGNDTPATLTVTKTVLNNSGTGSSVVSDFTLLLDGVSITSGVATTTPAGARTVSESGPVGYTATYGGDCASDGTITLALGTSYSCTITNDDVPPTTATLTVTKTVVNDHGGTSVGGDFPLFLNSVSITSGVATTTPAGSFTVSETASSSYTATIGGDCASDGTITMVAGNAYTCSITNDDDPATLTLTASVTNDSGTGSSVVGDFTYTLDDVAITSGVATTTPAGARTLAYSGPSGYTATWGGDCASDGQTTLSLDTASSCTLSLDDVEPTTNTLTVTTTVTNDDGGSALAADFALTLSGESITSGVATTTLPGSFTLVVGAVVGYTTTIGGDCASDGTIMMVAGNAYACSVAADDEPVAEPSDDEEEKDSHPVSISPIVRQRMLVQPIVPFLTPEERERAIIVIKQQLIVLISQLIQLLSQQR